MTHKPKNTEGPEDRHKRLLSSALRDLDRLVKESEQDQTFGDIHLILSREGGLVCRERVWREVIRM